MTASRKAAVLLIMLGEGSSSEVMKYLEEDEVQQLGREIAKMQSISSEQADTVLEEFYQMLVARDYVMRGGIDFARKVLVTAFGPELAKKMLDRLMKTLGAESANFDALQKVDPQQLAKFIHAEHPQTVALILSHLSASQAAGLRLSSSVAKCSTPSTSSRSAWWHTHSGNRQPNAPTRPTGRDGSDCAPA